MGSIFRYLNFFLIGIIGDHEKNYQKINRYTLTFCNSNLKLLLAYKNPIKKRKSYLKVLTLNKYNHLSNLKQFKNKKKNLITFKAPLNLVLNNFKQNEILSKKKNEICNLADTLFKLFNCKKKKNQNFY